MVMERPERSYLESSRSMASSRPTRTTGTFHSRAASTAPSTIFCGAKSPPMASTAILMGWPGTSGLRRLSFLFLLDFSGDEELSAVETAFGADMVRKGRGPAVGAFGKRLGGDPPVG